MTDLNDSTTTTTTMDNSIPSQDILLNLPALAEEDAPAADTLDEDLQLPQDHLDLDYTDLNGLLRNEHLLTLLQSQHLDDIRFRIENFPQRFARGDFYSKLAGILVMANWINVRSFSRCGYRGRFCKHWKYCPACAYQVGRRLCSRYEAAFQETDWHFLTISSEGSLSFQDPHWCDLGLYWDAGARAVKQLVDTGEFLGALKVEEVSLCKLPELMVKPHLHFLVAADKITVSMLEELRRVILTHDLAASLGNWQPDWPKPVGIELKPHLHVAKIEDVDGLRNTLHYVSKPIDLVRPYLSAISARPMAKMWELNQAVADFIAGHDCHILGRHQREAWGILDPRNQRGFIGTRPAPRRGRQNRILADT